MSDFRLWSDFRLSTLDRTEKERLTSDFGVGRSWFCSVFGGFWVNFGRFSGCPGIRSGSRRFLGIRSGALYCRFCGFSCLGGYLYHQQQKRLTEPQNSRRRRTQKQPRRSTPERSQKKSRQRSDRQRLLYLLCLFQDLGQDHERQNQHTQNSQFYTSLKARYAVRVGFPPSYRRIAESKQKCFIH